MYDKNQIEDSLEFVRQIKDLYGGENPLDTYDPLEDHDTDELFANLAYHMEQEERPWEKILDDSQSITGGILSAQEDEQEQKKRQEREKRQQEQQKQEEIRKREIDLAEKRRLFEERQKVAAERKQLEAEQKNRLQQQQKLLEEQKKREADEQRRLQQIRIEQERLAAEQKRFEEERRRQAILEQQRQEEERRRQAALEQQRQEEERRRQAALEQQRQEEERRRQAAAEQQRQEEERRRQAALEQQRQEEERRRQARPSDDAEIIRLQKRAEELQRQAEMASLEARMRQLQKESQTAQTGESVDVASASPTPMPMPKLSIPGMQAQNEGTYSAGAVQSDHSGKRKLSKEEIDDIFAKELQKTTSSDSSYQQRKMMLQRQADRLRQKREESGDLLDIGKLRDKAVEAKSTAVSFVWWIRNTLTEETKSAENQKVIGFVKRIAAILLVVCICALAAFLLASFVTTFIAHPTKVEGESMETTLTDGDTVIIQKLSYYFGDPDRYDVVVFPVYNSNTYYIKRIIGLPGETVQIVDGKVLINGKELEDDVYGKEDYIDDPGDAEEPITLAADEYFVLGDNRNMSTDSRSSYVGVIKKRKIAGKAWKRVLPFSKFGSLDKK